MSHQVYVVSLQKKNLWWNNLWWWKQPLVMISHAIAPTKKGRTGKWLPKNQIKTDVFFLPCHLCHITNTKDLRFHLTHIFPRIFFAPFFKMVFCCTWLGSVSTDRGLGRILSYLGMILFSWVFLSWAWKFERSRLFRRGNPTWNGTLKVPKNSTSLCWEKSLEIQPAFQIARTLKLTAS